MVSLHRKRRRVSKSHMARGGNLTTLNRERRVAKIAKVANARRVLAESAAKSAKADAAAAVVATACSEESIDLTALAAVNALIECSRPHLPYTSLAVAFTGRAFCGWGVGAQPRPSPSSRFIGVEAARRWSSTWPNWRRRRTSLSRPEITEEEREAFQITEGERVRAAVDGSVGESPRKKPHKGDKA